MTSFYCLKAYQRGGCVGKSPILSIRTLWMVPRLETQFFSGFFVLHYSKERFDIQTNVNVRRCCFFHVGKSERVLYLHVERVY